jgi:hypothetical protein
LAESCTAASRANAGQFPPTRSAIAINISQLSQARSSSESGIRGSTAPIRSRLSAAHRDISRANDSACEYAFVFRRRIRSTRRELGLRFIEITTERSSHVSGNHPMQAVRRQNLLDKLATELREDLVHLG